MKSWAIWTCAVGSLYLFVSSVGCNKPAPTPMNSAPVSTTEVGDSADQEGHADHDHADHAHGDAEGMAELAPEDRQLAEAQGFCVVSDEPLGSMGAPIKLMVDGQPAFVCCKGCEKKALADPAKTLAKVEDLKARVTAEQAQK